jgi:hypothetical protein
LSVLVWFGLVFSVPGTFISVPGANGGSCRNDHLIICFGLIFSLFQATSYLCLEQMVASSWNDHLIIYCGFLLVGGSLPSYLSVSLLHLDRNLLMNV